MLSGERSDILRKKEKGVFALKNQMLLYFFATMLLTLIFTALITRVLIPKLRSIKMGQKILDIGPRWHKSKEGTPTMGGIAFIIASVFTTAIIGGFAAYHGEFDSFGKIACVTALIILNGLIGFADDYLKFVKKQNEGLRAYQKFFLQSVTAILFLAVMTWLGYINSFLFIPFFSYLYRLWSGLLYYRIFSYNGNNKQRESHGRNRWIGCVGNLCCVGTFRSDCVPDRQF